MCISNILCQTPEEIGLEIISTAKVSNKFLLSPRTFLTSFHGIPQNFKHVFTGVNGSPRHSKTVQSRDPNILNLISSVSGNACLYYTHTATLTATHTLQHTHCNTHCNTYCLYSWYTMPDLREYDSCQTRYVCVYHTQYDSCQSTYVSMTHVSMSDTYQTICVT